MWFYQKLFSSGTIFKNHSNDDFVLLANMSVHQKNTEASASQKNAAIGPGRRWRRLLHLSAGAACGTRAATTLHMRRKKWWRCAWDKSCGGAACGTATQDRSNGGVGRDATAPEDGHFFIRATWGGEMWAELNASEWAEWFGQIERKKMEAGFWLFNISYMFLKFSGSRYIFVIFNVYAP